MMTSSVGVCTSSTGSGRVLCERSHRSHRSTCKLTGCFGRRESDVPNFLLTCNKCASRETVTSSHNNDVTILDHFVDDRQEDNVKSFEKRGDNSTDSHSMGSDGNGHRRRDSELRMLHSVFDDQTLGELIRQNMAANRVYIPTARSSRHERRKLFWRLRPRGDVVTYDVTCDDNYKADGRNNTAHNHNKITHCYRPVDNDAVDDCQSHLETTLDDSGIVLEGLRLDSSCLSGSHGVARPTAKQRRKLDIPVTIDCTEHITSRSRPRPCTSTHHYYRHEHRASQDRRAMKRVAEWIDRNHGGYHGKDYHGNRSTSVVLRIPSGTKLSVIIKDSAGPAHGSVHDSKLFRIRRKHGQAVTVNMEAAILKQDVLVTNQIDARFSSD